ncbi:LMBR1-like conserved region family protein [Trichomonas vaginalis G3]|uniref:LMBR1-like conserved region family protein n=1 Tax=Trichomonas vaginalis (strain ATCC PRA-98 / G3) TaxID=412133 RepID=A2DVC1_TRIV3|nr:LMBR1-like membrane protein family [Trichomonas vaginalis G3]EAY15600.1 LMBR1-like conserved region family protein [Trichomonas vaginalis G3]KAI5530208.1 LMBR1-like membrane protein family [Trichomonas vaginalis G3]|eukprot:XP_001327823.1 LMBR1-like conserved region family protein [Trichomonas vaginalis G3]
MDLSIIIGIAIPIICTILTIFLFWYFGAFYLPWYIPSILFLALLVAIFQVFGILPLDASWVLFGSDPTKIPKGLLNVISKSYSPLYWISFVLGWVVTPTITSFYTYNYGLTWGSKIWYAIRYNIYWYLWAAFLVFIGLGILIVTKTLTFGMLPILLKALSTAYGLILICLLLGHGFIALPIRLWRFANVEVKKKYHLFEVAMVSRNAAQAIYDARSIIEILETAPSKAVRLYAQLFEKNLKPSVETMRYFLNLNLLPEQRHYTGLKLGKHAQKIKDVKFNIALRSDLEDVLYHTDEITKALSSACVELFTEAKTANSCIKALNSKTRSTTRIIFLRLLSIITALFSAAYLWGELTISFKPKYSPFYQLCHIKVPKWISELFITFPILLILCTFGTWSLTKVRLGSYFKFIPHGTNDLTFYFFVVILGRLAPTIGYHYLMQVGGEDSPTYQFMNDIKTIKVLGDCWKFAAPIIMLLTSILVMFRIWDRLMHSLGVKRFTFDNDLSLFNDSTIREGESILEAMNVDFDQPINGRRQTKRTATTMDNSLLDNEMPNYGW